ncbi:MAG: hypothetical protein RJA26_998, partial [Actinomycetota bacterium]
MAIFDRLKKIFSKNAPDVAKVAGAIG